MGKPELASSFVKEKLDQIVLDIEFLLISVVQGVAVVTLAETGVEPISNLDFRFILYTVSAFFLIIGFWSQAIIHALSFIDWPMDLKHSFLYFLVGLIEVMTFHQMNDPLKWFGFMTVLFSVATLLYIGDLKMIKQHEDEFRKSKIKFDIFKHILEQQTFELKLFVPIGLIFNLAAFLLILSFRDLFINQNYHVLLIGIQVIFGILFLVNSLKSFKKRSKLITDNISNY